MQWINGTQGHTTGGETKSLSAIQHDKKMDQSYRKNGKNGAYKNCWYNESLRIGDYMQWPDYLEYTAPR